MAALRPDQAKTGAAGAIIGTPETQAGRYLDMTVEVRCIRK